MDIEGKGKKAMVTSSKSCPKIEEQKVSPAPSKRKLINKVRRKVKTQNERLAERFKGIEDQKGSVLGDMISNQPSDQNEYIMLNQVTMGQNRKLKKKMKKLNKKFHNDQEKVFKGINEYKGQIYKRHSKTIFNPQSEMKIRRQKRLDRMKANNRRSKNQVLQKNSKAAN